MRRAESDSPRRVNRGTGAWEPNEPLRPRATVLVAEDEDGVREVLQQALEELGCTVHVAAGIESALAQAAHEPIHLLITDLVMPDGNGRTLARLLAQNNPQMKTILISGYSEDIVSAAALAGMSVLRKPFGLDELLQEVRALLQLP